MKLCETNDDICAWITVLYGHNMKNGSMFGCLYDYKEADFFRQNSEILVYTETQCLKYEIVAAAEFSDLYLMDYTVWMTKTGEMHSFRSCNKMPQDRPAPGLRIHGWTRTCRETVSGI